MPRSGVGVYSLPANSFSNPVSGTEIDAEDADETLTDIETALTASIAKDGQTVATAAIPFASGITFPGSGKIDSTGRLGLGMSPTNILDITQTQNGASVASILNASAGTAASASFTASNGSASLKALMHGTGFTTSSVYRQNGAYLRQNGAGGLTVGTGDAQPLYITVNDAQVAQFTTAGLGIGMAATNILDITQSQNAISTLKVLNADGGTGAGSNLSISNNAGGGGVTHYGTAYTSAGISRQSGTIFYGNGAGGVTLGTTVNQSVYIGVNDAEVARFVSTNGGAFLIGATVALSTEKLHVTQPDAAEVGVYLENSNAVPGGATILLADFSGATPDNNTARFFLGQDDTATRIIIYSDGDLQNHDNSYGAISDERLKQDITDAKSQWDDIKNLRLRNFRFKSDLAEGKNHRQMGVIAQEAMQVSPGLVEEGDGGMLGVKYSILYLKAVGALQEAMARIEALEAKVGA